MLWNKHLGRNMLREAKSGPSREAPVTSVNVLARSNPTHGALSRVRETKQFSVRQHKDTNKVF